MVRLTIHPVPTVINLLTVKFWTGVLNGGRFKYADGSGFSLENQALVFKIKLPEHSRPFNRNEDD